MALFRSSLYIVPLDWLSGDVSRSSLIADCGRPGEGTGSVCFRFGSGRGWPFVIFYLLSSPLYWLVSVMFGTWFQCWLRTARWMRFWVRMVTMIGLRLRIEFIHVHVIVGTRISSPSVLRSSIGFVRCSSPLFMPRRNSEDGYRVLFPVWTGTDDNRASVGIGMRMRHEIGKDEYVDVRLDERSWTWVWVMLGYVLARLVACLLCSTTIVRGLNKNVPWQQSSYFFSMPMPLLAFMTTQFQIPALVWVMRICEDGK